MGSQLSVAVSCTMLVATLVYYYKMVMLTELTTEATLFNTLYAEYATPHMLDAIQSVEDFSHNTKLTAKQIICKKADEQLWDKKFDHDWQRIHHWYQKVVYFHRMGLLSERFYNEFPGRMRTRHFIQHVEPFAINSCQEYQDSNCTDIFDHLRKLYSLPVRAEIQCDDNKKPAKAKKAKKEEL